MKSLYSAVVLYVKKAFAKMRSSERRGELVLPPHLTLRTAGMDVQARGVACAVFEGTNDPGALKSTPITEVCESEAAPLLYGHYRNNKTGERRLPAVYQGASWRNTTPVDDNYREMGVGFDLQDGSTIRLRLSVESARAVSATIADLLWHHEVRVHSAKSSGMPNTDVSGQAG